MLLVQRKRKQHQMEEAMAQPDRYDVLVLGSGTGGNIQGMIKATEANLAVITDSSIVIPGHGNPVSNKAELQAFYDMLVAGLLLNLKR